MYLGLLLKTEVIVDIKAWMAIEKMVNQQSKG